MYEDERVRSMAVREVSRFKIQPDDRSPDKTLTEKEGWHRMDVRWLITDKSVGSTLTVVGRTTMPPGVKAQHAWHRHPNAEEWEVVIEGIGIKHVGEESFYMRPGDVAFVPRDIYHGLENASDTETLVTVWGYCGAPSLEKAGYVIPEDDPNAPDYVRSR
jgi:quercetin dioxygenase-like cupin family protein